MFEQFAANSDLETDSDEEIQEALASGQIKPGLVVEAQKKTFINNRDGMKDKIREFSLDKLKWIERMDLTNDPAPALDDPFAGQKVNEDDDFQREMRFYRQAQASVLEGLANMAKFGVITKRPEDYFAEMAKSDGHMKKVRSKLLEKKMGMERSEKAKKLREMRKYGKKVQVEVLQKRQKEKREMMEGIKKFRKGQVDKIDIMGETIEKQPSKQQQDSKTTFKPNKKREFKNKKFGFGGQKKRSKYNTADSAADVSEFNHRKAQGKPNSKGKSFPNQRPGKGRRKVLKNKNKK